MTCQKFDLPTRFANATVDIDVGRIVRLLKLDVALIPMDLPSGLTFNLTLNISSDLNATLPCVRINVVNFTVTFDCQNQVGRYLRLTIGLINSTSSASSSAGKIEC